MSAYQIRIVDFSYSPEMCRKRSPSRLLLQFLRGLGRSLEMRKPNVEICPSDEGKRVLTNGVEKLIFGRGIGWFGFELKSCR